MNDATKKTKGLTKQRQVVLQVIRDAERHLTANEIFDEAKKASPTISFATVYNSLRFLKEAGHIAELQFGGGAVKFDRKTARHDHAVCNRCGSLIDTELEIPDDLFAAAERISQFKIESVEVIVRGICPECEQKQSIK